VILFALLRIVLDELPDVGLDQTDLGQDFLGNGGPDERLGAGVPVLDVGADALDERWLTEANVPRRIACLVMMMPNQISIWFIQLEPTGMK
jgi:hypothetical protein